MFWELTKLWKHREYGGCDCLLQFSLGKGYACGFLRYLNQQSYGCVTTTGCSELLFVKRAHLLPCVHAAFVLIAHRDPSWLPVVSLRLKVFSNLIIKLSWVTLPLPACSHQICLMQNRSWALAELRVVLNVTAPLATGLIMPFHFELLFCRDPGIECKVLRADYLSPSCFSRILILGFQGHLWQGLVL